MYRLNILEISELNEHPDCEPLTSSLPSAFSSLIFLRGGEAGLSSGLITTDGTGHDCELGLGVNLCSNFTVRLGMGGDVEDAHTAGKLTTGGGGCDTSGAELLTGELATVVTATAGTLRGGTLGEATEVLLEGIGEHKDGGAGLDAFVSLLAIFSGDMTPAATPFTSAIGTAVEVFRALEFLSLSLFFSFFSRWLLFLPLLEECFDFGVSELFAGELEAEAELEELFETLFVFSEEA